ncbi:MAG: siderophore-interacting protein [Pseudomonadota bacterium]
MPQQYDLTVVSNDVLTPHMRRIVLHGDDLREFPDDQESGYVKVAFTDAEGDRVLRSYTIRRFDAQTLQLTLDFVDHGDSGPASKWAGEVDPGAPVSIFGPGEKKLVDPTADWVLLGGDLSALPALSVNLEVLPQDAKGYAVVEVPSEADIQPLTPPTGVELIWVVNSDARQPNKRLTERIRELPWLDGTPYPWFAGEFEGMRAMRSYFRDERGVHRKAMYLSCYWKLGEPDEGMKRAKRRDAEADEAALQEAANG